MEQYISVGEVRKLTGVSVGSLRYYEKLGILKPAYINESTNYRYYTHRQILLLDIIAICVDMDIPLKEFKEHIDTNGHLNLGSVINKGLEIAKLKQEKIQHQLNLMENIALHLEETEHIMKAKDVYEKSLKKRHLMCIEYPYSNFRLSTYENLRSELIQQQPTLYSKSTSLEEGILFRNVGVNNAEIKVYLFLEVGEAVKNVTMTMPSGTYTCYVSDKFPQEFNEIKDNTTSITMCRFIQQKIYSDMDMNVEIILER